MDPREELKQLYQEYRPLLPIEYRWEDEQLRWQELVYAIFAHLSRMPYARSRTIISSLGELDLLDIENLSGGLTSDGRLDVNNKTISCILKILELQDLETTEAESALLAICEAARSLTVKYGKLQHFLRQYAKEMLEGLANTLSFSAVDPGDEQVLLTLWLQNVLELPLPSQDATTGAFCQERGFTPADLVAAADDLNINVAVLDDLVEFYAAHAQSKNVELSNLN